MPLIASLKLSIRDQYYKMLKLNYLIVWKNMAIIFFRRNSLVMHLNAIRNQLNIRIGGILWLIVKDWLIRILIIFKWQKSVLILFCKNSPKIQLLWIISLHYIVKWVKHKNPTKFYKIYQSKILAILKST